MALIRGTNLKNTLTGTSSDDLLIGLGGNDSLNGGAGIDTAWFSGNVGGYHFSNQDGKLTVRDSAPTLGGMDGTDSLSNIEKLQFSNAQLSLSAEFRVNTFGNGNQFEPSITALADGGFVVSWQSRVQDGSGYGIYAQRYNAAGGATGAEFRVNTFTLNNQSQPSITALADGGFIVSWTSLNQDGSSNGIYAQRYHAAGGAAGAEFQVNTNIFSDQQQPSVTALADGGFIVSWTSDGQDGSSYGIYAQRYTAAGVAAGAEFQVNTFTLNNQSQPSITALADGGFIVSWVSHNVGGLSIGIYAQRYNAAGVAVLTLTGSANADVINLDLGQSLTVNGAAGNDSINGSTGDDVLLGGADNDTLKGNAGSDYLDGGIGVDNMAGGAGDDNYVIDNAADIVTEGVGAGNDSIYSLVTKTLALNFENLFLTGLGNINGTGNAIGNYLEGNSGNNELNGLAGADVMSGGAGNDTYIVDNVGDYVDELLNSGTDLVKSSVGYTLTGNVENLTLTGIATINGTGNGLANILTGNAAINNLAGQDGNDTLNGLGGNDLLAGGNGNDTLVGGTGNDTLVGEAGLDTFVFNTALSSITNVDNIISFVAADDIINLSKAIFTGLGTVGAALTAEQFRSGLGNTAVEADDRIIHNSSSGELFYDSDGTGAAAAVKFATLVGVQTITAADFFVI